MTLYCMPELPEVENVVTSIRELIVGCRLKDVFVYHKIGEKTLEEGLGFDDVLGLRVASVNRKGKYIWIGFNRKYSLVTHLGMSGQYLALTARDGLPKHARLELVFSKGARLVFNDSRCFGYAGIVRSGVGGGEPAFLDKVGFDVFDLRFSSKVVAERYLDSGRGIKSLLLDQGFMSGVGNIYADEALWLSGIHPDRKGCDLSRKEVFQLIRNVKVILKRAVSLGGTSFDYQYVGIDGKPGRALSIIKVYGREGLFCFRCADVIERIPFGGRYSRFCPSCQKL